MQKVDARPMRRAMRWKAIVREGLASGTLASVLSAGVLLWAGRAQNGRAAAPLNAVSHSLWGRESLRSSAPDWKHTAAGYATHHGACVFWGTLHAAATRGLPAAKAPQAIAAGAAATAALAYLVDYYAVPKRLTPGFEHRLSSGPMLGVYAALALGIAAGALLVRRPR